MFLIPKMSRHPFYPKVLAAHRESQGQHMLHLVSRTANMQQVQTLPDKAYLYTIHSDLMCPCCMHCDMLPCCKHNGVPTGLRQCLRDKKVDLRLSTAEQSITHHSNTKGCATRPPSAFQDVGACLGQDTRRLMTDGWGQHQIVALDLVADYW